MKINNKSFYLILILILFIGVTIGYAVINSTLNINGKSSISKNTWDVYFDNINVGFGSVEAVKTSVVENSTTVDFEVALNLPGDFYEFTVDVVNDGTIDAMIESINKTPDLTSVQQKYLNYTVTYENGKEIFSKQLVNKESFVRLKVRVEYKSDITASDLPTVSETLNLGFNINYVQADSSGVFVKNNGESLVTAAGDVNEIGTVVTIGTEQFYTIGTEGDNVKLLSMYNLYVGSYYAYDEIDYLSSSSNLNVNNLYYSNLNYSVSNLADEPQDYPPSLYPLKYPTNKQSNLAVGYVGPYPKIGVVPFSKIENNTSDYNSSVVKEYVDTYKNIIEDEFDVDVIEARLITKEELISDEIGCDSDTWSCVDAPFFISSTSYWTFSSFNSTTVWSIGDEYDFMYNSVFTKHVYGVRPVIVISKNNIKKNLVI